LPAPGGQPVFDSRLGRITCKSILAQFTAWFQQERGRLQSVRRAQANPFTGWRPHSQNYFPPSSPPDPNIRWGL
jgi:hypothetical protein